ncbi:uncharacterized protein YfbL-like isoform X2 [Dreissena polymorpha]|uniref:uncharacterized protein YfbL-like isoform X2 n=1 Tax=Dreissena polymorpha TaxID=45954 RepID=UPI0022641DF7|nr:uncharacterized protein YfbL-like isoform X2 [Dreissena polymorpha]
MTQAVRLRWCLQLFMLEACVVLTHAANLDYLRSTLTNYFSDTRHHAVKPEYKQRTATFIHDEFIRFGLETTYHNFVFDGVEYANIIGVLKGDNFGTYDDQIIGVGAHYDTVNVTKGVDDNGSGSAALLEVARQMTSLESKRKHTVIFTAFDREEYEYATFDGRFYGALGSKYLISQWLLPWIQKNYPQTVGTFSPYGIIVLDTLMDYNNSARSQIIPPDSLQEFQQLFPGVVKNLQSDNLQGDFLATIFRTQSDSRLANEFHQQWGKMGRADYEIEMFGLAPNLPDDVLNKVADLNRSDHINFWAKNIPAIFLSDSANLRGKMQDCYHHTCDSLEVMLNDDNLNFLAKTSDTIAATVDKLSQSYAAVSGAPGVGKTVLTLMTASSICVFLIQTASRL